MKTASVGLALLLAASTACGAAAPAPPVPELSDQAFIDLLEQRTFQFFWDTADPGTGLIPDRHPTPSFASISAVGFGLTAYVIGAERGYVTRDQAAQRVLKTLRFLERAPQGPDPVNVSGYRGFYYHFLDMKTGLRFKNVELSTIDTALLIAGALTCRAYFDRPAEAEIRAIANRLNERVEWTWAMPRANRVSMGWTPEEGFNTWDWHGYMEAMLLEFLAMGSPTHPIPAAAWPEYTKSQVWGTFQGQASFQFGPLFGHQYSHVWIDFRGIQDRYMRARQSDYFVNSVRATYANRNYCVANPGGWEGYGTRVWGLTASDGPLDPAAERRATRFHAYWARGAGPDSSTDDGTIAPSAVGGSVPFAPELAVPTLVGLRDTFGYRVYGRYGFKDAFNLSYRGADGSSGWFATQYLGIDEGPIVLMIENYRSGFLWDLLKKCSYLTTGLRRAGFTGGWLDAAPAEHGVVEQTLRP